MRFGFFESLRMVLSWLPKLFLGSALLAGTGIGLGSVIFSSGGTENVELTSEKEFQLEETKSKIEIPNEKEAEPSIESSENNTNLTQKEAPLNEESPVNIEQSKREDTSRISSQKVSKKEAGCTIHQLNSSRGSKWNISEVGTWEKFLGDKTESKQKLSREKIERKCKEEKNSDILVFNKDLGWGSRIWDYSEDYQNHTQFKTYLSGRKK